ncbi:MAG: thiamine pyrophosphate-binding protein [Pirellulales bacterium]|nr:thiamine pyrophosphate-binding protein [Pirellulales bacterium]
MTLADSLVTTLRDWGLQYAFGVGGANIEHFYDAVHRLGEGRFRVVAAKSEIGAAFMADCRARVHRTLGVCCATSGGGMMNLAVGVAEAFAESVPMLAIVGQPPASFAGRGAFQDSSGIGRTVNADKLWSAISKYRAVIDEPSKFWPCLESAVREALSGRPGPSVLLIPRDLFDCEVGNRPGSLPYQLDELKIARDVCDEKVRELFDAIQAANTPVLLVGSGVDRCGNPEAVVEFARRVGMRVATTLSSKSSFPNDDPLYLGMVGMAGEPSAHRYLQEEADLIVAVGTGLNMMTTQPIQQALRPERLAVVNIDVGEVLRVVTPALHIEADAGAVFAKLNQICDQVALEPRVVSKARLARFVPQLAPRFSPDEFSSRQDDWCDGLLQSDALEVLQQFLPTSGHVLFDAGNCAAAALHYLRIPRTVSATCALGMGGMGYAISAAVGAQLGSPRGARTIVFCGDGAFLMSGAEVNTAVHYRLPVLFVVFNNGMHGMCVTRQQLYFGGRIEGSQYPAISVSELARGLGSHDQLWVGSAGSTEELTGCLADYQAMADGPGVLELRLEREQIPPFTPFLASDAPTYDAAPFVGA